MEAKINIVEILKHKPQGTKLYSSACGKCRLGEVDDKSFKISFYNSKFGFMNGGEGYLDKNGKLYDDGECVVFPSKEMRDWSKFAWKKGDVLVTEGGAAHIIFEKFTDDTYTIFAGKYYYCKNGKKEYTYLREYDNAITEEFTLETEDAAKTFIGFIEKRLGGKLNRETLEVEEPKKKPAFEIGKLYVFNEEDEDGELTIIGKLIGKNENEDTLTFGNQYEIENEKFVTDQAFDLRISVHEELREATEGEAITFQEACTLWEKSKKQGKDQPPFKTFDKVLVRCGKKSKWLPAFFVRVHEGFPDWKCSVFLICSGKVSYFSDCIPFEGNEQLLGTTKDVED